MTHQHHQVLASFHMFLFFSELDLAELCSFGRGHFHFQRHLSGSHCKLSCFLCLKWIIYFIYLIFFFSCDIWSLFGIYNEQWWCRFKQESRKWSLSAYNIIYCTGFKKVSGLQPLCLAPCYNDELIWLKWVSTSQWWDCWIGLEVSEAMSFPVPPTTSWQEMKLVLIKVLQRGFRPFSHCNWCCCDGCHWAPAISYITCVNAISVLSKHIDVVVFFFDPHNHHHTGWIWGPSWTLACPWISTKAVLSKLGPSSGITRNNTGQRSDWSTAYEVLVFILTCHWVWLSNVWSPGTFQFLLKAVPDLFFSFPSLLSS